MFRFNLLAEGVFLSIKEDIEDGGESLTWSSMIGVRGSLTEWKVSFLTRLERWSRMVERRWRRGQVETEGESWKKIEGNRASIEHKFWGSFPHDEKL